jgi:hypothetical protein
VLFSTKYWTGKSIEANGSFSIKNIGDISLNADNNIVFKPLDQTNYLTSSFGLLLFLRQKRNFRAKNRSIRRGHCYYFRYWRKKSFLFKICRHFVLGLGLTASVGYSVYQSQIATATVLVETAVQKQVNNKIQEATFFIKSNAGGNPFCKKSVRCHIVAL